MSDSRKQGDDMLTKNRPSDILVIGDSMIKRLQVYGHGAKVWKFCYPGGLAESMNCHIPTEKLPGEALVGIVMINVGTNDLSRSRDRIRTSKEVVEALKLLIARMGSLYPQALIIFMSILPRLDYDNVRVTNVNQMVRTHINKMSERFDFLDYSSDFLKTVFPGPRKVPIIEYYRNFENDAVHLSDSGTQVQQDAFNRFFGMAQNMLRRLPIDLSKIMWQSEWDRFNYWNFKTANICVDRYLKDKRITNFTMKQYMEVLELEKGQKTRDLIGPQTRLEAESKPYYRHLGE